jgi:hypothetical protein
MYNVSYINWIVLILLFVIFFTPWRKTVLKYRYINDFFYFILFFFFFSQFFFFFNL